MAKIYFMTFGCTLNFADSEMMQGLLVEAGHSIVDSVDGAELVVVNSCSVKQLAEKKFFKSVSDVVGLGKKVVCAGCVPQAEQSHLADSLAGYSVIGTKQLNKIVHVVEETLDGNVVHFLKSEKNSRLNVPKVRRNAVVGIVPISEGCLGECTYCKARLARGKLMSYDASAIVDQVKSDVADGCREIWLTSQDCGAYGKDIDTNIVDLLKKVCAVPGEFFVRLGMMNPNFALEYLDELIDLFESNKCKLFWFIHIPLQAGSDDVLRAMKRKYNSSEFVKVCESFRSAMPEFNIATDVICGFPGETEDQFSETLEVVRKVEPDVVNISRFWARHGTPAALMSGQLHGRDTNVRSRELQKITKEISLKRNKFWLDWKGRIIIDAKNDGAAEDSWFGRNYAYKPVMIKGDLELGDNVEVSLTGAEVFHLEGELK